MKCRIILRDKNKATLFIEFPSNRLQMSLRKLLSLAPNGLEKNRDFLQDYQFIQSNVVNYTRYMYAIYFNV